MMPADFHQCADAGYTITKAARVLGCTLPHAQRQRDLLGLTFSEPLKTHGKLLACYRAGMTAKDASKASGVSYGATRAFASNNNISFASAWQ